MQVHTFCFRFVPAEGGQHCQKALQVRQIVH